MNLELLKKLVKLANNNPNDNEANLAARKVCKMIEEAKFNFNNQVTITPKDIKQPDIQYESKTYNDINRTTEPFWRSTPQEPWFDSEKFKRAYQGVDWAKEPPIFEGFNKRQPKERRALKCKTCGYKHETVYVGPEELFECNPCQWTAYQNRNK